METGIKTRSVAVRVEETLVLEDVSFEVSPGTRALIQGESGSGKSVLLKTLCGRFRPEKGTINLLGYPLDVDHLAHIRSKVAYLPQQIQFQSDFSVEEFIHLPFTFRRNRSLAPAADGIRELLNRFHLDRSVCSKKMDALSGGERQRVALVRALLMKRPLLLMDEATSAMDGPNQERVFEHIRQLDDVTILAVSHDPRVRQFFDILYRLEGGTVIVEGGEHGN